MNGTAKFIDEVISDYIDIYFEKCLPMKDRFILKTFLKTSAGVNWVQWRAVPNNLFAYFVFRGLPIACYRNSLMLVDGLGTSVKPSRLLKYNSDSY